METLNYTRQAGLAVMAWMAPVFIVHGQAMPVLAPNEPMPTATFRFDAKPGELGQVPVAIVRHLVNPHGNGTGGNASFLGAVERGELRFKRSDLVKLGYTGPVGASSDPLLGYETADDSEARARAAQLEAEVDRLKAEAGQSQLDKEIELARLHAQISADDRARAADERLKAEAEARKAEARKAEAAARKSAKPAPEVVATVTAPDAEPAVTLLEG